MSAFKRDKDGNWTLDTVPKNWHQTYADAMLKCFNDLDQLFAKAQETCAFEFILSLLAIREITADSGWFPFDTLHQNFRAINSVKKKFDKEENTHVHLLLYGLIVEASEPYEMLANLMNVIEGDRAKNNFPPTLNKRGDEVEWKPIDKIRNLQKRARQLGIANSLELFDDFYDNQLRNAVFHCSYTVYDNDIRLFTGSTRRVIGHEEKHKLINGALAYYEVFTTLINQYIADYDEPIAIEPHPDFKTHNDQTIKLMIRKGHGVVGIKDNWSPAQLRAGFIPFRLSKITRHEQWLLNKYPDIDIFPKDRTPAINRLLKCIPKPLKGYILKFIQKNFGY
ncbi:MAG: hypothetical protein PHH13_03965 [Candidatus Peribacteraceae bacterium]|nr:hypothetical protein [Candidatus Peribacteraceae bacterium]